MQDAHVGDSLQVVHCHPLVPSDERLVTIRPGQRACIRWIIHFTSRVIADMVTSNKFLETCVLPLVVIFLATFSWPVQCGKDKGDNIIILGGGHGGGGGGYGGGGHGGMPLILITGGGKKKGEQTILVSLLLLVVLASTGSLIFFSSFQIIFPQRPHHHHHFVPSYGHSDYGHGGYDEHSSYSSYGGSHGEAASSAASASSLHAINEFSHPNKKMLTYSVPFPMKIRDPYSNSHSSTPPSIMSFPEIREI